MSFGKQKDAPGTGKTTTERSGLDWKPFRAEDPENIKARIASQISTPDAARTSRDTDALSLGDIDDAGDIATDSRSGADSQNLRRRHFAEGTQITPAQRPSAATTRPKPLPRGEEITEFGQHSIYNRSAEAEADSHNPFEAAANGEPNPKSSEGLVRRHFAHKKIDPVVRKTGGGKHVPVRLAPTEYLDQEGSRESDLTWNTSGDSQDSISLTPIAFSNRREPEESDNMSVNSKRIANPVLLVCDVQEKFRGAIWEFDKVYVGLYPCVRRGH